jgi:RecB family endonuclease NucS
LNAVSQLRRYVESIDAGVRGVLVVAFDYGGAEQLLQEFGAS